ncbi:MAG: NAD-glutamate dehydrogenase, partial [Phenylobacterium sp.]|uniref:NAD-glutamate dehydrogenase n=1 Tax=Phenylobacterium sp. TaxID=1871053 RepID=UPI00273352DE
MSRAPRATANAAQTLRDALNTALGDDAAAAASFADQAARDDSPEDFPHHDPKALAADLADFWRFGDKRRGRKPSLRVLPASGANGAAFDRLEIVQDDSPFLVRSVMGEIAEQGLSIRALFHPVVEVRRDRAGARATSGAIKRESMIQVVLDAVGGDREAALIEGVQATLADVHAAVDDFKPMLALVGATLAELKQRPGPHGDAAEEAAFLEWLQADHFVFLGARTYAYPRGKDGALAPEEPLYQAESGLGILRDPERTVLRRTNEPAVLAGQVGARLAREPAVTVAKSNLRTRVHRRGHLDYVSVKRYDAENRPIGETRFVGLFTAEAYDHSAIETPLVRGKIAQVLRRSGAVPGSHNESRLKTIVEGYPRDELFQIGETELLRTALGVLHLYDRPRVKLFERRDPFDRFASILLFVPRERYDSDLQRTAGEILAEAYGGRVSAVYPTFLDAPLARIHFIIGFTPREHAKPDLRAVETRIAEAARTWGDRFESAARVSYADPQTLAGLLTRYAEAFPAGYRDRYVAAEALEDLAVIESLTPDEPIRARAARDPGDPNTRFRFKLYRPDVPAPLSDVLPILENMGLRTLVEEGYPIRPADGRTVWVHDFQIEDQRGEHLVFSDLKAAFEDTVVAVWSGRTENDGFNRMVLELSIPWREAALIRALARHRQQTGLDPGHRVQEQALSDHPGVARLILDMFRTKFDPAISVSTADRVAQARAVMAEITEALQLVQSLDDDRVLRRLALLVDAAVRTNFYQSGPDGGPKPYISFKVASRQVADLPAPKPYREIFVWGVGVEGVHLRFGPVARGGLRWSDRRDDFRTEVLGLAKAQQVKNAVIVPVGSKGGFYPKQLPRAGAPDQIRAEGVRAYTTFLQGLLDITDNLTPEGQVVRPSDVIAHDDDDPYLVVAADKGTASFSDIANGVAESYGFWLGDAFASGGSAGYDHKVMAITARGAWEAAKRHFRELGKDIQAEPFSVIGVGDMSGDVFGNGILLSRQIQLKVAFDHRHIFFDPTPDPETSWQERKRLFDLPRSSWDDYDRKLISAGGGVFSRTLKVIPLSEQVQALLGVEAASLGPAELISAILKAQAEMLYLGGIGTYVKARSETNPDVGDKANDAVRVNGRDLRCRVVVEGANLGFTQRGRIEFALAGGRIDTDAIDNSAGVDCSDHEVNIKIVTGALERSGKLTRKRRDALLRSMTDEVADHVLAHNYDQTLALSLMQLDSVVELDPQARFMVELETAGRLDRAVESLPDAIEIEARRQAGSGLSRPELAVMLAYGKLELSRELVDSPAPDDDYFDRMLLDYFPKPLRRYDDTIQRHRLRREIIATSISNDLVNRCGPTFASRLQVAADCDVASLAAGYEAARVVLDLERVWASTAALDGKADAHGQLATFQTLTRALRGKTFWLARRAGRERLGAAALIHRYGPGLKELRGLIVDLLSPVERAALDARVADLTGKGAPEPLARQAASLLPLTTAADLVDLAQASSWPLANVARLYHQLGEVFAFDRLRSAVGGHTAGDHFERIAVRRLVEDLLAEQTELTRAVMTFAGSPQAGEDANSARHAATSWSALRREAAASATRTIEEIEAAPGGWSFAKLTI